MDEIIYDIADELIHCRDEVDLAIKNNDMVELKRIIIREGLEWIDHFEAEKYISELNH